MTTLTTRTLLGCAVLLLALAPGCKDKDTQVDDTVDDSGGPDPTTPSVLSNTPLDGAINAPLNRAASAVFSEAMDAGSLSAATFSLGSGDPTVLVDGTVIYGDDTAVFWPAEHLELNTEYTATVSTGALSAEGMPLAEDYVWSFTTGESLAPGLPVDLGTSGDFVILAKSGISTVPASLVTGDIGVSPAAATYITGFTLTADSTNAFATSTQVVGRVYASDYAAPTPAKLTTAVGDMERAFTDAAGRAPNVTELGSGNIGGLTLEPGVYKWGTGLLIPTDVTLNGGPTEVWIFQIAQDLTVESAASVLLSGGADADNVFWQVSGKVEIGTTAHMEGNILTSTSIDLRTGASANGRLLAQTAVDIDGGAITVP